jgi:V8-like Glu-specific endopeptidase
MVRILKVSCRIIENNPIKQTLLLLSLAVALVLLSTVPTWAQQGPLIVGVVRSFSLDTPHPYPAGASDRPVVWSRTIESAGAAFLRVHFVNFELAPGDYLAISNPDGSDFWTYTGRGPHDDGDFWSFIVKGDALVIEIHAGTRPAFGFRIDEIGHGTVDLDAATPEVICGTDGREDVACHLPMVDAAQKPVARLIGRSGVFQVACTGWLVKGSNANTLMTNDHCFDTQREWRSIQATFNYQNTNCGSGPIATTSAYSGNSLLRTNNGLDYAIGTLNGNPEATWGELTPTSRLPVVGSQIWFIQHPGGGIKKIGYWEDAAQTTLCHVNAINKSYGGATAGSQVDYGCDSEGGSSGSPIVEVATGQAVGLHHFGGVSGNPCLNAATQMQQICANAGSLLMCAP